MNTGASGHTRRWTFDGQHGTIQQRGYASMVRVGYLCLKLLQGLLNEVSHGCDIAPALIP